MMDRAVLDRQIHGHISRIGKARLATVSATDPSSGLIKVMIQPENIETGWLNDCAVSVGAITAYAPAETGSHVLVETVQGDGDNYIVVARIFDNISVPPIFSVLGRTLNVGEYGISAGESEMVVTQKKILISGDISVSGNISVSGEITASGDVKAGDISLSGHRHSGVQGGSSQTTTPI